MALIVGQEIIEYGLTPTMTELAASSNTFTNGGREFICITYTGEGTITVEVEATVAEVEIGGYGKMTKTNPSFEIDSLETGYLGTFATNLYNGDDGIVTFTVADYVSIDEVSVAILSIAQQ